MVLAGLAAGFGPSAAGADPKVRRAAPASLLFEGRREWKGFLTLAWTSSDAKGHRENEMFCAFDLRTTRASILMVR